MSKVLKITLKRDNKYWYFLYESPIAKHDKNKATREKYSSINSSKVNDKYNERSIMQFKSRFEILSIKNRMRNSAMYLISQRI